MASPTTVGTLADESFSARRAARSGGRFQTLKRRLPLTVGALVVLLLLLAAAAAPLLAPGSPEVQNLAQRLRLK